MEGLFTVQFISAAEEEEEYGEALLDVYVGEEGPLVCESIADGTVSRGGGVRIP